MIVMKRMNEWVVDEKTKLKLCCSTATKRVKMNYDAYFQEQLWKSKTFAESNKARLSMVALKQWTALEAREFS